MADEADPPVAEPEAPVDPVETAAPTEAEAEAPAAAEAPAEAEAAVEAEAAPLSCELLLGCCLIFFVVPLPISLHSTARTHELKPRRLRPGCMELAL